MTNSTPVRTQTTDNYPLGGSPGSDDFDKVGDEARTEPEFSPKTQGTRGRAKSVVPAGPSRRLAQMKAREPNLRIVTEITQVWTPKRMSK
jgi:hypothetical protein